MASNTFLVLLVQVELYLPIESLWSNTVFSPGLILRGVGVIVLSVKSMDGPFFRGVVGIHKKTFGEVMILL